MALYRVITRFTGIQGAPYISNLYFDSTGGTPAQAATAASTFWAACDTYMVGDCTWTTDGEVATVNEVTGATTAVTPVSQASGSGGLSTEGLSTALQALIRWRTGSFVLGREVRGRCFIPGMGESENIDGRPSGTAQGAWSAAGAALIADANSLFVVWSRKHGVAQPAVSATVWNDYAVLRSRRD